MMCTENKPLLISLIKDDLINSKLVHLVNNQGMNGFDYLINLGNTVFKLMGFTNNAYSDDVFGEYLEMSQKAHDIDISISNNSLNELAAEIYRFLELKAAAPEINQKTLINDLPTKNYELLSQ